MAGEFVIKEDVIVERDWEEEVKKAREEICALKKELHGVKDGFVDVLHKVKEQMDKKKEAFELEVKLAELKGKTYALQTIVDELHSDSEYESYRTDLEIETAFLRSQLHCMHIPEIEWENLGFPFMR